MESEVAVIQARFAREERGARGLRRAAAREAGGRGADRRGAGRAAPGGLTMTGAGRPSTREATPANGVWRLRLYVAGQTPKALTAFENLKKICESISRGSA